MLTFKDYIDKHYNIKMPSGEIPGSWFSKHGLPMVVACTCCQMTMASPSALVDEDGSVYCSTCGDQL